VAISVISCSEDENAAPPLVLNFEISVTGEAPNAEINITNTSEGGSSYLWEFSQGAEIEISDL
jgi:PKD repeat protein